MSTPAPTPPPLGQMLVRRGLVTEAELVRALHVQEQTRQPLGETLVQLGAVSVTALADALLAQHAWRPLGRMLVDRGLLTEAQLASALDEQERTGRPLGEIVRTRHSLSASVIGDVLAEQHELELEMERGFGSGLRGGIDRRQHGGSRPPGAGDEPAGTGPLTERIGRSPERDRITALEAALENSEEIVSALGMANRDRHQEVAALRATIAEQAGLIEALRARVTELEAAGRRNGTGSGRP